MSACPFRNVLDGALGLDDALAGSRVQFPLMALGQACDMGTDANGVPLVDPRIFDSVEFQRNPYPYYRILRDHYPVFHDPLHNAYWVTRYDDITACYMDEEGFNTIPKGMSSGVLGNTQLELSGIEHRRRRNLYGRHLIGKALDRRLGVIERLAAEMIDTWTSGTAAEGAVVPVDPDDPTLEFSVELGAGFANEFPIRVVCQVLGFPDEARSQFFYWYSSMMNGLGGSESAHRGIEARQDLEDYVESLVAERRARPTMLLDDNGSPIGPDIISELCASRVDGNDLRDSARRMRKVARLPQKRIEVPNGSDEILGPSPESPRRGSHSVVDPEEHHALVQVRDFHTVESGVAHRSGATSAGCPGTGTHSAHLRHDCQARRCDLPRQGPHLPLLRRPRASGTGRGRFSSRTGRSARTYPARHGADGHLRPRCARSLPWVRQLLAGDQWPPEELGNRRSRRP